MTFIQAMLLTFGAIVVMFVLVGAATMTRKGVHPPTYRLGEEWTHPPILWAAVDETMFGHHQAQGGHDAHGDAGVKVGGSAHGTW